MNTSSSSLKAYVGTYTSGESEGIYSFTINSTSGKIESIRLEAKLDNPTYLDLAKNNKYLYSVIKSGNMGGVAAFEISESADGLRLINHQLREGSSPCHVSLDSTDSYAFSANYHKGEAIAIPLNTDGSLSGTSSIVIHEGSGPNKDRQEKPHAHYSALTPDNQYLCVVDLGIDKLVVYKFDNSALIKHSEVSFKPGCGPRHMDFHADGKFAYLMTELSSEVVALNYNEEEGSFSILQYISALPENFTGESSGSAIHVSPDGRYVYASNRGHDSIAVFSIDSSSGELEFVSHTPTEGSGPRDFNITPDGSFLIVANQNSSNIVPYSIDKNNGTLTRTGDIVSLPNPVCIKFLNE